MTLSTNQHLPTTFSLAANDKSRGWDKGQWKMVLFDQHFSASRKMLSILKQRQSKRRSKQENWKWHTWFHSWFVHHLALLSFTALTGQLRNWLSVCKVFDLMLNTTRAKMETKPLNASSFRCPCTKVVSGDKSDCWKFLHHSVWL